MEQSVSLDPDLAEAHAVLALAHAVYPVYFSGSSLIEARNRAMQSARRALELEPDNASALAALGWVKGWYDFDLVGARESLEKAVESNPGSAEIQNFMGDFLAIIGDFETSLVHERKAAELDPLAAVHHADIGVWLHIVGRHEGAIAETDKALEIDPTHFYAYLTKTHALIYSGKFEAALETVAIAESLVGEQYVLWLQSLQCHANAAAGHLDQARENLKNLMDYYKAGQLFPFGIATCYVFLHDFDNAGHWLDRAFTERSIELIHPLTIRLPEQAHDSVPWQSFWKHPEMAALAEMRRSFHMSTGITATSP